MKIVNLYSENVLRLKAVDITPEGPLVLIGGNNGQGKSSTINSMFLALAGRAASKEIARPVRDGAEEAEVRVDLGDLLVTRKWAGDKTSLSVTSKDGAKYSAPQSILDKLRGTDAMADPVEFAQLPAVKQKAILMGLVELPFNPEELDAKRKGLFDQRTDAARELKRLEAQLAGMHPAPAGTPDTEVSLADLLEEHRAASLSNARTRQIRQDVEQNELLVAQLRERLALAEADLVGNRAALAACPPMVELADIQDRIDNAENVNANVRANAARAAVMESRAGAQTTVDSLTAGIAALDKEKADGLAAADFPIKGLGFDEDGVTFNDVPFTQASSAERLRVSTAMCMALNPELRVLYIRDGSLLDDSNLDLIGRMAEANDFQIWVERVGTKDAGAIIIEDGEVVA
jgi:energy-coupling factor transporter ATP-binding protein EcfA2